MSGTRKKKISSSQQKKGQGLSLKGWFLSHISAILLIGALLFVLSVSFVAVGYVIFLYR